MGVSTNGQLCFGLVFEKGFCFPWDVDVDGDDSGDIEQWWRKVNGYKPPFELYTDDGNGYVGGVKPSEKKINEYYDTQNKWDREHPMPVMEVNYCSGDCPMYILAVPESFKNNRRGYPEKFDPKDLTVSQEGIDKLLKFCKDYDIEYEGEPGWYLTSLWM
jgi:hypothetical protein